MVIGLLKDMGYHILASVLLCVAGIVFTVSTAEIVAFVGTDDVDFKPGLLSGPKYFAGVSRQTFSFRFVNNFTCISFLCLNFTDISYITGNAVHRCGWSNF